MVSNNKASGLSARTEDLVHKQLNPQAHEYKLSKLSGIQVHPFTNTLTCSVFASPHSDSPSASCNEEEEEEDPFLVARFWIARPLCFSLNRAQPTWESHFRNAPSKSVNGSGADLGAERPGWEMGSKEVEIDGNWRKPEKKRMKKKNKPNMKTMVEELVSFRDFKSMMGGQLGRLACFLSP